jgi:fructose/tagatose bisphosphate aldolase
MGRVVPAFNVPYLPMVEPVIRSVVDEDCFALVEIARLEWLKFEAQGPAQVMEEFLRWYEPGYVWLHLDHVPVVDEDGRRVDYLPIIREAIALGYHSVMVDGSRLGLEDNIQATSQVVELAHRAGIPCEAELGAVLGHEAGPLPPYDELFDSGLGFSDAGEAQRFVQDTGCDWLSVAVGNIHGAVSGALKDERKIEARLHLGQIERLRQATQVPLVLHGGSGIQQGYMRAAVQKGIAKINVGTEIRQAYETARRETGSVAAAQQAVYDRSRWLLRDYFGLTGSRKAIYPNLAGAPEPQGEG